MLEQSLTKKARPRGRRATPQDAYGTFVLPHRDELVVRFLPDGTIVEANPAYCQLLGLLPPATPVGQKLPHITPEKRQQVLDSILANLRPSLPLSEGENWHTGANGELRCVHWIDIGRYDEHGRLVEIIATGRDITEIKRVQTQLEETRQLNQAIIDHSPVGILAYRPDGQCVLANQAAARAVGATVEQLLQQNFRKIESWKKYGLLALAEKCLRSGKSQRGELAITTTFGKSIWIDCFFTRFASGGEPHLLLIASDITERKQAEQNEREQRTLAEALRDSAAALTQSLRLEEVLAQMLEHVERVVAHDAANISLINEVGMVEVAAARENARMGLGEFVEWVALPLQDTPLYLWMTHNAQPVWVEDIRRDPRWVKTRLNRIFRSYAAAPIRLQDNTLGFLNLFSRKAGFFTPAHAERLMAFANQAAAAIQNAHLYRQMERAMRQTEALRAAGLAVGAHLELEEVLAQIFKHLQAVLRFDLAGVLLVRGDSKLELIGVHGFDNPAQVIGQHIPLDASHPNTVIMRTRRPLVIDDVRQHDIHLCLSPHDEVRAWLGAPLIAQNKVIGVLNLACKEKNCFSQQDASLAEAFAAQVAVALHNALLFARVEELAVTDGLTGLYNRRHFFALAENECERARRYDKPLSLLMIDIDRFKSFNDSYGHLAGDQALRAVAETSRAALRRMDILARYGGEEFVALLPETQSYEAREAAERLRQNIAALEIPLPQGGSGRVTLSIGLAAAQGMLVNLETMLDCADRALYAAKQNGRNRVEVCRLA
ncbi:MAG: diguanylate cyclase [Anaerolineae bacterium]|nr:diguanylate cyclase [Anaerolineae bacterium]